MSEDLIHNARRVLAIEAQALLRAQEKIDETFILAIKDILQTQGRVILTGMGKSGHIAAKIASTLASTGTPAFFVHPAEAAHGDLGMIVAQDSIIVLSHSGESEEILLLFPALKKKGCTIIAITGNSRSRLAKWADITLLTPIKEEACPLGLAPTTSTTLSLALGDALAVALLQERQFTSQDFALSHPAGSLGKSLLLSVSDLMVTFSEAPILNVETPLKEAIIIMSEKGLGLALIDDRKRHLLGIFTDGDLRRVFQTQENLKGISVGEVMNPRPKTISPITLASEALRIMEKHKITSLAVVDDKELLQGVITLHHILSSGVR